MIKNYFLLFVRNLRRQKLFSSINLLGLTVSIASTLLIYEELPEVELMTSIHTPGNFMISYTNDEKEVILFEQDNILAADSNFFRMFTYEFIYGQPETALLQANTMVMTASTAKKYFGDKNPVGKLVRLVSGEKEQTYEVTAVIQDTPENSYLQFDALLSMTSFPVIKKLYWSWVWT